MQAPVPDHPGPTIAILPSARDPVNLAATARTHRSPAPFRRVPAVRAHRSRAVTTLVLPRLYAGWWPLPRAFGFVATAIVFGLMASMLRGALWPVASGADADAWISGAIVFVVAGVVAALLASAAWELRVSSFAWNTPALDRRLRREITVGGFVIFGIGAGVGASRYGALTGESWFLAVAAALGFSVGLVNSLSRPMWARFGGALGVLLACFRSSSCLRSHAWSRAPECSGASSGRCSQRVSSW